jgi:predicted amidohydrolase
MDRPNASVVAEARACDLKWAVECNLYVVRADVAGEAKDLLSYGSSEMVAPTGTLIRAANTLGEELLVADITENLQ